MRKSFYLCLFLAVALLSYAPSFHYFYFVTDGLWLEHSVRALHNPFSLLQPIEGYFRPLTKGVYALFFLLFQWNPFPFHLFQIVLHGVNGYLLFLLGKRLFPKISESVWLVATIYFIVATSHAQAVFWTGAFYEPLGAFFLLLAILSLLQQERWGRKGFALSLFFFSLGLLSREIVFGFLVLLPFLQTKVKTSWKRNLAYYGVGLLWLILYFFMAPLSKNPHRHEFVLGFHLFSNYILGFKEELLRLIYQPLRLYGEPDTTLYFLGIFFLAAALLWALPLSRKKKSFSLIPFAFGLCVFIVFFFPLSLSSTFPLPRAGFSARYRNLYLPDIGWSIALAGGLSFLEQWVSERKRRVVCLLLAISFFTVQRSSTDTQFQVIHEVSRTSHAFFHLLANQNNRAAKTIYLVGFPLPLQIVHQDHLSSFFYALHKREGKVVFVEKMPQRGGERGGVVYRYQPKAGRVERIE